VNFEGAVTWAFEFEDQPYFDGFRDLATNGIDKPVLNVFRMFGLMGPERIEARSSGAAALDGILKAGIRESADIGALASRSARSVEVMLWHYHDDDLPAAAAPIELSVRGLPEARINVQHYRVDGALSNSFEEWKKMGSPQKPTPEQYAQLERSGQLQLLGSPEWRNSEGGQIGLKFELPRQGVSLVKLTW
jgi:xylan 1,4-beta-xylosidase